jgi:hypothetical protein
MSLFWTWSVDTDTWNKHRYALFLKGPSTMVGSSDYKSYAQTGEETDSMQGLRDLVDGLVCL